MKKKNTKQSKSEIYLQLDGAVYVIEKKKGKEIDRQQIDSEVVLRVIINALSRYLDQLDDVEFDKLSQPKAAK